MEKTLPFLGLLLIGACRGGGGDDPDIIIDTAAAGGGHPLVPAEYRYYWNTDSCMLDDGSEGAQTYWLAEGSIDAEGKLAMTERWFWFFGQPDYTGDCVDTFELTGAPDTTELDPATLGCASCDGVWAVQRTLTEDTCGRDYTGLVAVGDGSESSVDGYVLVDLIDSEGRANAGSAVVVVYAEARETEGFKIDAGYATGNSELESLDPGEAVDPWPTTLDWLGSSCIAGP